jgi:dienelactone hydrolase
MPDVHWALFAGLGLLALAAAASDLPDQYREPFAESYPIRKQQLEELDTYLGKALESRFADWTVSFDQDFTSIEAYERSMEAYRAYARGLMNLPPPLAIEDPPIRIEQIGEDQHARIYRVWIEVMEGVESYGLYMVPRDLQDQAPLLIAVHGGGGCPEAICDLDTRVNYNSFGPEAVKRGYLVWAPYTVMRVAYGGDPEEEVSRESLTRKARWADLTMNGLDVYKIQAGTRALVDARPEIDPDRIGMTGLSYGGFFTLHTMAVTPWIKVGVVSGMFRDTGENLHPAARGFGQIQAAALICPRPLMLQNGENDSVVSVEAARVGAPKVEAFYQNLGLGERFEFTVHPGAHEFHIDSLLGFFDEHL